MADTDWGCGHLHVRLVIAQCPEGHGMAALAGTNPEPDDEALIDGFAALVEKQMPDLAHGCRVCGAPQETWNVEVYTSPPLASLAEADALVAKVTALVMGDTVKAFDLDGTTLVPTVVH